MVLESVVICLDSSCYMINNDYSPVRTRWVCQVESAESISRRVINGHPESVVGILVTAGDNSTSLLSSPVRDLDVLVSKCRQVSLSGQSKLVNSLNKALLVLKFRKNRNGEQRIIMYVGSPVEGEDSNKSLLQEVGRKLKLNNISIDIVSFGDSATMERNEELLNVLKESANKEGGRSSTVVQIGKDDSFVATTDRLLAGDANLEGGGGSGNSNVQFPNDFAGDNDDDLMLALRISAEEAQAAARVGNNSDCNSNSNSSSSSATAAATADVSINNMELGYIDDDELQLQEAIKMSMMNIPDSDSSSSSSSSSSTSSAAFLASLRSESVVAISGNDAGDDDLHAIAMSMTASSGGANEVNFNLNESELPTPSTTIHASKRLRIETPLENISSSLGSDGNSSSSSSYAASYVTPRNQLAASSPQRPSKTPNTLSADGVPNLSDSSGSNSSNSSNSNSSSISDGREKTDNSDFPEFLKQLVQKVNVNPNDIAIRSTIDHLSDSNTEDKQSCTASRNDSDNLDDLNRMAEEPASSNSSNNDAESGSGSSRKRKSL